MKISIFREKENSQVNNQCFLFKKLKKRSQIQSKPEDRKNLKNGINEIENRNPIGEIHEIKSLFF